MRAIPLVTLLLAVTACSGPPKPGPTIEPPQAASPTEVDLPTPTNLPPTSPPEPSPTPTPERTNWLLLGGDYRPHRKGTGWGNKTDVMVLISILRGVEPVEISIVQFPRNLYVPVRNFPDTWMFSVWDQEGWPGLHYYFQEVFGISLQGIFYVDMDGFVQIIDDIGGVPYYEGSYDGSSLGLSRMISGEETLAYLRDNDNNWNHGSYDAGQRVFGVLSGMYFRAEDMFFEDPIGAVDFMLGHWKGLIQTDLANIKQWYWMAEAFLSIRGKQWHFHWEQLEAPFVVTGDVPSPPLNVGRGLVPAEFTTNASGRTILQWWMEECVFNRGCSG